MIVVLDDWSIMKENTVEHILEKGTDLIFKNGFHSMGLQKILTEANIPKGSFYYYFKSKEDFGLQVIDFYSGNTIAFMKTFLENEARHPRDRVFDLLSSVRTLYQEQNFKQGCLLGNFSLELAGKKEEFAKTINKNFNEWQDLFAHAIAEGQENGSINTDRSASEYASFLLNSWEGALVRMKATRDMEPMNLFIDFMQSIL